MTFLSHLRSSKILAVMRLPSPQSDPLDLARKVVEAGISVIECTLDSADAFGAIARIRDEFPDNILVGAGTVTTTEQIDRLADIGASFTVSPHFDELLIARARAKDLEPIPGVLTPTEVQGALECGASVLKLFPAAPMGTAYLEAMCVPFPNAQWLPTGGLQITDVEEWLRAGACCVGIGAALWATPDLKSQMSSLIARRHAKD